MENFLLVFKQVAILFVLIGAGAVCRKTKLVDEQSVKGMVNVLITIVTPSLIIECFQRPFESSMLVQFALAFAIAAAMHVFLIVLSRYTAKGSARELPVLRVATVFSNAGFMGIPLEYAILGPKGVFYGIVYVTMFNLFMWTWGVAKMREEVRVKSEEFGGKSEELWNRLKMLINPGTVGLLIGLPLFLFTITLPEIVKTPVKLMSELNTPLAMLVIGYYLAGADLRSVIRSHQAHLATFLRLVVSPLVLIAVFFCLQRYFDRTMMLALTIAASAPVGAMVTMFASKYDRDVDLSVALVSGSTIVSILTMPPIIALAMGAL